MKISCSLPQKSQLRPEVINKWLTKGQKCSSRESHHECHILIVLMKIAHFQAALMYTETHLYRCATPSRSFLPSVHAWCTYGSPVPSWKPWIFSIRMSGLWLFPDAESMYDVHCWKGLEVGLQNKRHFLPLWLVLKTLMYPFQRFTFMTLIRCQKFPDK